MAWWQARRAAAQVARAQAAIALADTVLLAPGTGTIIARVREPGSMAVSQGPVYSLSLDAPVYVRAYVGEPDLGRSEEHTSELQSLMRISYAVFCLKKKKKTTIRNIHEEEDIITNL